MQVEDKQNQVFDSVKSVYIALAAYANKVAQEIGMEKAMDLLTKSFEEIGMFKGKKLKRISNKEKINANEAYELIKQVPKSMGINFMLPEKEPNKVITRLDMCPVYDSAKVIGLDPEDFCAHTAIPYFNAIAKQLNSDLEFMRNKVKVNDNDFCEEQLILK